MLALKKNLLSVGQMMGQDYKVIFDNRECTIKDKRRNKVVVAKGKMIKDRLFKLVRTPSDNCTLKMSIKLDSDMWHKRFDHLGYRSLELKKKLDIVDGLLCIDIDKSICKG